MSIFKNSRVYVLATVAYTGSFLFGKLSLSLSLSLHYHNILINSKDMTRV
jgi:hypothetical protein